MKNCGYNYCNFGCHETIILLSMRQTMYSCLIVHTQTLLGSTLFALCRYQQKRRDPFMTCTVLFCESDAEWGEVKRWRLISGCSDEALFAFLKLIMFLQVLFSHARWDLQVVAVQMFVRGAASCPVLVLLNLPGRRWRPMKSKSQAPGLCGAFMHHSTTSGKPCS